MLKYQGETFWYVHMKKGKQHPCCLRHLEAAKNQIVIILYLACPMSPQTNLLEGSWIRKR